MRFLLLILMLSFCLSGKVFALEEKQKWYACTNAEDCILSKNCKCGCTHKAVNKHFVTEAEEYNSYIGSVSNCVTVTLLDNKSNHKTSHPIIACEQSLCTYKLEEQ